jgi:hypothetical protein
MKMKSIVIVSLFIGFVLTSCNWAKDKTKDTLHKGGEIVGKAGSEVVDGVAKGVEDSFANIVEASTRITGNGIKLGRVTVNGTDSTTDNIVSVYLIFDKHFEGKITAKALDNNGLEFGRVTMDIVADSGQAKFVDFEFDRRTNIDRNDRVRLE